MNWTPGTTTGAEMATDFNEVGETYNHFKYNPATDRLEADVTIQAGLNSVAWGEAWTQSSGGIDLSFREEFRGIDHMPITISFKDQSVLANQDSTGVLQPVKRTYADLTVTETAGAIIDPGAYDPANPPAMIDYEGLTTLSSDLSTYGIRFRLGEALASGQKIYYNLYFDDNGARTKIFSQTYTASAAMAIGDYVDDFWWSQPATALVGQVVFAEIRKVNQESGDLLQVYSNAAATRHWNEIRSRSFTSSELASALDVKVDAWSYKDANYINQATALQVPQNFPSPVNLFSTSTIEASTDATIESGGAFMLSLDDMVEVTANFKVDPQVSSNNYTLTVRSVSGSFNIRAASVATSRIDQGQTLNFVFPAFKVKASHVTSGIKIVLNDYDSTNSSAVYDIRTTIKNLGKSL